MTGTVTDARDATPLAGVRVDIAEGATTPAPTQTDDAGHYTIEALPTGAYTIRAALDGFETFTTAITLDDARTVDFQLTHAETGPDPDPPVSTERWRLSGVVIASATHAPLAGARVEVMRDADHIADATTGADGRFDLPDLVPGPLTVRATADGFAPAESALVLETDTTIDLALDSLRPPGPAVAGRVLDVLSDRPLSGVHVAIVDGAESATDDDGGFTVNGVPGDVQHVRLTSPGTIERYTQLRTAGEAATLTLMPRTFNLTAFDQMLRARGDLHRWTQAPRVVIQRRVLTFTTTTDATYVATADEMTEAEVEALIADLTWALPQLTGQTFTGFAGIEIETAAPDDTVEITRSGTIVVARVAGLEPAINAWGYGRWAWNGAGEVQMGVVMLDSAFEQSDSPYRRSLRAHELGHALGYDHVADGISVMHASGRIEPTVFDHDATRIAFRRTPLNQSPDIDPDPITVNRQSRVGAVRWEGAP